MEYLIESGHYKGGTLSWKPTNPYSTGNPVEIMITEKHSWTLSRFYCNQTIINTLGSYFDSGGTGAPVITCQSSVSSCISSYFVATTPLLKCTDFSTTVQVSTGMQFFRQNLSRLTNIDIAFASSAWATVILQPNGALALNYSLLTHINLNTTAYPINSSPGKKNHIRKEFKF
jgi:hypothetical protein